MSLPERRFLLLPDGLPRVEHEAGWFPYAVETLRRGLLQPASSV